MIFADLNANVTEESILTSVIVLLIAALLAAAVWVFGSRTAPQFAGPVAFAVFVIGALIALFVLI
jgi:hypothetical protein